MTSPVPSQSSKETNDAKHDEYTMRWGRFSCQMLDSDDQPMRIYGAKTDDRRVDCYVEAREGGTFKVELACRGDRRAYETALYIRDVYFDGMLHTTDNPDAPWNWKLRTDYRRSAGLDGPQRQPLVFTKLAVTDDDKSGIRDRSVLESLQTAKLCVNRVSSYGISSAPAPLGLKVSSGQVWERAKKGEMCSFGAGPTEACAKPNIRYNVVRDPTFEPLEFVFHCTSRIGLELLRLVPAELTQAWPVEKRPSGGNKRRRNEDEDEDEIQETILREQLKRIEERRRARQSAASSRSGGTVKAEAGKEPFDFSHGGTAENPLTLEDSDSD